MHHSLKACLVADLLNLVDAGQLGRSVGSNGGGGGGDLGGAMRDALAVAAEMDRASLGKFRPLLF